MQNIDLINNLSRVIITKCGHTFHKTCFKNYIYANLICPKCPICYNFLLEVKNKINTNISIPKISEINLNQTNVTSSININNLNC